MRYEIKIGKAVMSTTNIATTLVTGAVARASVLAKDPDRQSALLIGRESGDEEAFGPIVGLYPYKDVHQAIRPVDKSDFGLQAGLFTNDMRIVDEAFDVIDVGGLMVNDVPTFRIDHMPYGGVKQSGSGREGLRYAIGEMKELQLLTFNRRV